MTTAIQQQATTAAFGRTLRYARCTERGGHLYIGTPHPRVKSAALTSASDCDRRINARAVRRYPGLQLYDVDDVCICLLDDKSAERIARKISGDYPTDVMNAGRAKTIAEAAAGEVRRGALLHGVHEGTRADWIEDGIAEECESGLRLTEYGYRRWRLRNALVGSGAGQMEWDAAWRICQLAEDLSAGAIVSVTASRKKWDWSSHGWIEIDDDGVARLTEIGLRFIEYYGLEE